MVSKQALMVYNPLSGKKKNHKYFPLIVNNLSKIGYRLHVQSLGETELHHTIKTACNRKWDAIFIAGGDGTVNHAIQIVAGEDHRPLLGVFPFGTSNEFAKFIGTHQLLEALAIIEEGFTKPVDIGKFGNQYFCNIAAAGWLTNITYETSPYLKSKIGELAYYLYFLKEFLKRHQGDSISIRLSSEDELSDLAFFLIMNGNSIGPFNRLLNRSSREGYFQLITYKQNNRIRLLWALFKKMLQFDADLSMIQYLDIQAAEFKLTGHTKLNLDGEQAETNHVKFQVLPQHIRVFSPALKN